jgi:hypothetical protein
MLEAYDMNANELVYDILDTTLDVVLEKARANV